MDSILIATCHRFNYEITNLTIKERSGDVTENLECSFNKYRFNLTVFVIKPLNNLKVNIIIKNLFKKLSSKLHFFI